MCVHVDRAWCSYIETGTTASLTVLVDVAVSRQASAGIHSMVNIALAAFCVNVLQIDVARFGHMHLCRTVQRSYPDVEGEFC